MLVIAAAEKCWPREEVCARHPSGQMWPTRSRSEGRHGVLRGQQQSYELLASATRMNLKLEKRSDLELPGDAAPAAFAGRLRVVYQTEAASNQLRDVVERAPFDKG